jgi:hypothetical protein
MSKQNELIVFLHNDLDAAGCMLNLEFKYHQLQKNISLQLMLIYHKKL